jgi:ABC-type amino acid transport substrate-binding protein
MALEQTQEMRQPVSGRRCRMIDMARPAEPTLVQLIQRNRVLRLGVAPARPYAYLDGDTWSGIFVDVMRDWTKNVVQVGLEFVPTSYQNMIRDLGAHQFDVAAAISPSPRRALLAVFTKPLIRTAYVFAVDPERTRAGTWAELNREGITICVKEGSAADAALTSQGPVAKVMRLPDAKACEEALIEGSANALMDGWVVLGTLIPRCPQLRIIVPDPPIDRGSTQFALRVGSNFSDVHAIDVQTDAFINSGRLAESYRAHGGSNPLEYVIGLVPEYIRSYGLQFER